MASRNDLARARLQAQLNKKKNEGGAVEALDKQREKLLAGEYTPALLLEYMEKLQEKFNGDAAVRPLLMSSVHAPLLEYVDDFTKFQAKFQESIPKKKKKADAKHDDTKAAASGKDEAAEKLKKEKEAAKKKEKNAKKKAKAKAAAAGDKKDDKKDGEKKAAAPAAAAAPVAAAATPAAK